MRSSWVKHLERLALPVLEAGAAGRLKATLPVEQKPGQDRAPFAVLEAVGRLLAGLAPWLELEDPAMDGAERALQLRMRRLAGSTVAGIVDPASPDFANVSAGGQPLVDAAFLCHAFLRAPRQLWESLPSLVQDQTIHALDLTRRIPTPFNNWLLFAGIIEAFRLKAGRTADRMRIDYALRQHEAWYKGDGVYGDGPKYAADYYNSYVIHPMLRAILDGVGAEWPWKDTELVAKTPERMRRWAALQERMIAPDGSFPATGRSLAYRCGAFQSLADSALRQDLPEALPPSQVRCALGAVINRTLGAPGTYDAQGWLRIGLAGAQPGLGEGYICTGSLYLCSTAFLPLGLPAQAPFWSGPDLPWTNLRIWRGEDSPVDHAI
jgi:hypothetical protein